MNRYRVKPIDGAFTVCELAAACDAPDAAYWFLSKTDNEVSLVCETARVPRGVLRREDGWRAFRIDEELDFSLIGVLAAITTLLAAREIGVFVVSTYRTDYVFVKETRYAEALRVLAADGYIVDASGTACR